ncbi:hypothetical protein ZOSMA_24G00690 [Zostera marina]|uniref:Cytochrome P450 n=1 Tax=Zostera marina TaxID=29655 RepID=A0A0K9PG46_ZOSMR|nr:hypothetical protein ZOSMA_24G00690 [Zostera marina]
MEIFSFLSMEDNKNPFFFIFSTLFIVFLSLIIWSYLKRFRQSLPPGPLGVPLLGNLPFIDPQLHFYFTGLAKKYGPIISTYLGLKLVVVVSSSSLVREVLRDKDAIFANRDVPVSAYNLMYGGEDIAFTPNCPKLTMMRKVTTQELLGGATLQTVQGLRKMEVRAMIKRVKKKEGEITDMSVEIFTTMFKVITSMLWGGGTDEKGGEASVQDLTEFKDVISDMAVLSGKPDLSDFFPFLEWMDLQGVKKEAKFLNKRFDGIFEQILSGKVSNDGKDFLDVLMQIEKRGDENGITKNNIKAILLDFVTAGTDTTSSTIEFAVCEMLRNPDIMNKVQEELDRVVGSDTIVEERHISDLHYLYAVFEETLRLYPPIPFLIPHSNSEASNIGGYNIPARTRILINVWSIHRDPQVWEDPLVFKPERFIKDGGGKTYKTSDFKYFPFGSGRRMCVGMVMAHKMFMYVMASLLHSFNLRMPEGHQLDFTQKFGMVLQKKTPLQIIPSKRLSKIQLYD